MRFSVSGAGQLGIYRSVFVVSVAAVALTTPFAPVIASTCATCSDADPIESLSITSKPWTRQASGWKFRTRLQDADLVAGDVRRFEQVSSLTTGNDYSAISMLVERVYSNKRKPIEQINLPSERQRRSRMEIGYQLHAAEQERFGLKMTGVVERRRLGFAALRGKWANNRMLSVGADWTHAEQWRLSTSYTVDQSHNPRTGIRRSIQLAAGAPPSASEIAVAVDYSPSFLSPDRLRIGIEARSDRLAWSDATAFGMRDRDAKRLAMRVHMAL
jgi:hypothetical protein